VRWSRVGLALAGVALGAVLLAISLRGASAAAVWGVLAAGNWGWPVLVAATGTLGFVFAKVTRWQLLLGGAPRISRAALTRPVVVGMALNSVIPHSGELLRAVSLQRRQGRPAAQVLASIFIERLFDLFAVLLLGGAAAIAAPAREAEFAAAIRIVGGIASIAAVAVVYVLLHPAGARRAALAAARPLPGSWRARVAGLADDLIGGMRPVGEGLTAARVLGWSLLQWLSVALCVLGCADITRTTVAPAAVLLVVVGLVVAFLLPNAPAYVGATQLAFWVALQPAGVPADRALAASVAYQLLMIVPIMIVGLAWLKSSLGRSP